MSIKIGFSINVELKQGQEMETLHKAFFTIWIGKNYPLKDIKVFCKTTVKKNKNIFLVCKAFTC